MATDRGDPLLRVLVIVGAEGDGRLSAGDMSWEGRTGDLIKVPDARHALEVLEDSTILLTVAKLP